MADEKEKQITIRKAEMKEFMFLKAMYSEYSEDSTDKVTRDCKAPIHDDLKLAFKKLNIHLLLLTQQIVVPEKGGKKIHEVLEEVAWSLDPDRIFSLRADDWLIVQNTFCTAFEITGSGDNEGIVLSGHRTFINNGRALSLTNPVQKWDDDQPYPHISELGEIIDECKAEVKEYLFEGKHAPDVQGDLFAEPEDEDDDNN